MRLIKSLEELKKLASREGGISISIYQYHGPRTKPTRISYDSKNKRWLFHPVKPDSTLPHILNVFSEKDFIHTHFYNELSRERIIYND